MRAASRRPLTLLALALLYAAPQPAAADDPTPTPTPVQCGLVVVADTYRNEVSAVGESFPPDFDSCTTAGTTAESSWLSGSETFARRTLLLDWQVNGVEGILGLVAQLPAELAPAAAELVPTRAWLRLTPVAVWNDDGLSLVADWRPGQCDETDDTDSNAGDALSPEGACGAACRLDAFTAEDTVDLPLAGWDLTALGTGGLRLQISGTPAAGRNGLEVADGSGELPAPQLVVELCLPPPEPELPGCHTTVFIPDTNSWTAAATGASYPPSFTLCEQELMVRLGGTTYFDLPTIIQLWIGANTLLRWDTSALSELPENAQITGAALRATLLMASNDATAGLAGEWYDWGETCDDGDYTSAPGTNALGVEGRCGETCRLPNLPVARTVDLPLDGAAEHINRTGPTSLRVGVQPGEMPAQNLFAVVDLSSGLLPPRLVVHWCEMEPGCERTVLDAVGTGPLALGMGETYPPEFAQCGGAELPEGVNAAGQLFEPPDGEEPGTFLTALGLMQWDTSALPPEATVERAWVRLQTGAGEDDDGRHLVADWHEWESCSESDYTTEPAGDALSAEGLCGESCAVANLLSPAGVRYLPLGVRYLPLDGATEHIVPEGTVGLRLAVDGGEPSGMNFVFWAHGYQGAVPQLVVDWCVPMPTPTPTPTPTPAPAATDTPTPTPTWDPEWPTHTPTATPTGTPTPTPTNTPLPATTLEVEILFEHGVGDGFAATDVPIGEVAGIATDASGSIFLVDAEHGRLRQIDAEGTIHTLMQIIGSDPLPADLASLSSVAVNQTSGTVYAADDINGRVWALGENGPEPFAGAEEGTTEDGGPATEATLSQPVGLSVGEEGTVYIAELGANRIRMVSSEGTIGTLASDLPAGEVCHEVDSETPFGPQAITVAGDGVLYALGAAGTCIERILPDGTVERVPLLAQHVHGLAAPAEGPLFAAATELVGLDADGWTAALPEEDLGRLGAIAVDGSDILAYDEETHYLLRVGPAGTPTVIAGNGTKAFFGDGGTANGASFGCAGMAVDAAGQLWLGDPLNGRIAVIDTSGVIDTVIGGPWGDNGQEDMRITRPTGLVPGGAGVLYVADADAHQVYVVAADGSFEVLAGTGPPGFSGDGQAAIDAQLNRPSDVALAADGSIYVADAGNGRIRQVDTAGVITTLAVLAPQDPDRLRVLADGSLLVSLQSGPDLLRVTAGGEVSEIGIDGGTRDATSLSILAAGADGRLVLLAGGELLVASALANPLVVERYTLSDPVHPERPITDIVSGSFDPAGDLLLCDSVNRRILRLALPGGGEE